MGTSEVDEGPLKWLPEEVLELGGEPEDAATPLPEEHRVPRPAPAVRRDILKAISMGTGPSGPTFSPTYFSPVLGSATKLLSKKMNLLQPNSGDI